MESTFQTNEMVVRQSTRLVMLAKYFEDQDSNYAHPGLCAFFTLDKKMMIKPNK